MSTSRVRSELGIEHPYAKDAGISQRTQKKKFKVLFLHPLRMGVWIHAGYFTPARRAKALV